MREQVTPEAAAAGPWEGTVRQMAAAFPYPATPELAGRFRSRLAARMAWPAPVRRPTRLAWALLLALLIGAALLAVPQVRAGLLEFLQVGDIRLFLPAEATAMPTPAAGSTAPDGAAVIATQTRPPTGTPEPTPTPNSSIQNLLGETSLAAAARLAGFPVAWPSYPPELGRPDHVYFQQLSGPVVILVWLEPDSDERARLVLYELRLEEGAFGGKFEWRNAAETTVGGGRAYWVEGAHMLLFYDTHGNFQPGSARFVAGNVLIWEAGDVTYRLESSLELEEARRVAESLAWE